MILRSLLGASAAAIAGATMLALSMSPAAAFTLSGPSIGQPAVSGQIDKVCWHCGWHGGWHGGGWGWHHGYGWGGGWRHCWINRWGNRVCNW